MSSVRMHDPFIGITSHDSPQQKEDRHSRQQLQTTTATATVAKPISTTIAASPAYRYVQIDDQKPEATLIIPFPKKYSMLKRPTFPPNQSSSEGTGAVAQIRLAMMAQGDSAASRLVRFWQFTRGVIKPGSRVQSVSPRS